MVEEAKWKTMRGRKIGEDRGKGIKIKLTKMKRKRVQRGIE